MMVISHVDSRRLRTRASGHLLLVALLMCSGALHTVRAQSIIARPIMIQPPAPAPAQADEPPEEAAPPIPDAALPAAEPGDAAVPPGGMSKEDLAELKAAYLALPKDEQREVAAYYKEVGLDLDAVFGISSAAMADAQRVQEAVMTLGQLDFARTPANVLSARAKLGFGQVPQPHPASARGADIATWIHLQVMAGEWQAFAAYLAARPKDEAQSLYSRVLQSLNSGRSELLPEEVIAISDAAPEAPKAWQSVAWAAMLKAAAAKNSPAQALATIKAGTKYLGDGDAVTRRRTIDLLSAAGLVAQAYEYITPLTEAREAGDGDLILVHALYQADLATKATSPFEATQLRRTAWDLFCEASLAENTSMRGKKEAIKQAVAMMSKMPRSRTMPWLRSVFADDALGTAALETIVLSAAAMGEGKGQGVTTDRAQSIVTLKEAVDILLERRDLDKSALRVPMRMLTTSLVTEMEAAQEPPQNRYGPPQPQVAPVLLRAIPSAEWIDALEPSLSTRVARASINIAVLADETDIALGLVADAIRRTPDQARAIADAFLLAWEGHLRPQRNMDDDMMIYYFWREYVAQAPLTRGRQRRNLERLGTLIATLKKAGIEARTLPRIADAFKACHGITEVYDRADIERVFGPLADIPPGTAAGLAATMASSLNGDWRNRAVQVQKGVNRTDTEIAQLVDKGYGVAIALTDSAIAHEPDSWNFAVLKAGLAYDRLQFKASQKKGSGDAKETEYRAAAFAAFEKAAQRYVQAIQQGEDREDAGVFERWFGAAMGTSQLNFLAAGDLPEDGTPQDDQVERVRKAITALPPDSAARHLAEFAADITAAVNRADPEVKPRLVKQALRVVGEHPAGAALRALNELYRDLVKDEIKLRLVLDGEARSTPGSQFGVLVSLRFTNPVDRETGGFSKYLQTSAFVRVGRQYQEVNFREKLQKNIETAFGKSFNIESTGFFDPFMPPRGVVEDGQDGWIEKPMAYVILSRKDPATDRLPQLTMDMQFEDQTGPVTLVLPSNTPALGVALSGTPVVAPVTELKVSQAVDPRDARDGEKDRAIKLEVTFRGKGTVPDLRDVLDGVDSAISGYTIGENGIEARPPTVIQEGNATSGRFSYGPPNKPPEGGYPEPDEHGMFRLPVERSWTITYTPKGTAQSKVFTLPQLKPGVRAALESKVYSDLDLVPVVGPTVRVDRPGMMRLLTLGGIIAVLAAGGVLAYRRARPAQTAAAARSNVPENITPLGAVMMLRRLASNARGLDAGRRGELEREIATIELEYFGPGETPHANGDLKEALRRWVDTPASTQS